jgi:homoserine dehydrogenase
MTETIKVALVGLGEVGELFAETLLEQSQLKNAPVKIVAVADRHLDSPVALGFAQSNIPVFEDAMDVVDLGDKVDIIFNLTENPSVDVSMNLRLMKNKNRHTVIVPVVVARLLQGFFSS